MRQRELGKYGVAVIDCDRQAAAKSTRESGFRLHTDYETFKALASDHLFDLWKTWKKIWKTLVKFPRYVGSLDG